MSEINTQYKSYARKKGIGILIVVFICIAGLILDIIVGSSDLTIADLFKAIFARDTVDNTTDVIVWVYRLPTAIMGLLAGFSLGISGSVMQTILGNPLASPYTLGISAGAGVGASMAMLTGLGSIAFIGAFTVPFFAFIFSMIACLSIYYISRLKGFTPATMILTGIGMVFFFQAIQSFMQYSASAEALQGVVFWTFGSLQRATWQNDAILGVVLVVVFIYVYSSSWKLTAMQLGDTKAAMLGVDVIRLRRKLFIATSLLTSVAVAFVGTIGFIGIVGPHIARMIFGEDQRYFIPMSGACGAAILMLASFASKVVKPGAVFPIGILTAIIGVPFFFALIIMRKR